jgi:hypothetical protein
MREKKTVGLLSIVILALISGLAVSGLLTTSITLPSSGTVRAINVEVYWDSECTLEVNSIDWGAPEPGQAVDRIVYVKNTGNLPLNLSISTSNWYPSNLDTYLNFYWNREGRVLAAGEVTRSRLTIEVSSSIAGINDFSFDIIIQGTA